MSYRQLLTEIGSGLWSRGVTRWFRCGLSVSGPFVCRCLTSQSCSVSTPRSSNRTGAFRASGSRRKVHEVAHGKLRVRAVRRTNPSTSCRTASGNRPVAGHAPCAWRTATDAASFTRVVHRPVGFADRTQTEVVGPSSHHAIEVSSYRSLIQQGLISSVFIADRLTDADHPLSFSACGFVGAPLALSTLVVFELGRSNQTAFAPQRKLNEQVNISSPPDVFHRSTSPEYEWPGNSRCAPWSRHRHDGRCGPGSQYQSHKRRHECTVATQSNGEGNYELPYLLPGQYRVTTEHPGFKSFRRDAVEVRIGDRITIPIQLELGQVSDQVTVTSETPALELASANVGQVIDAKRIAELPTAHGNPFLLMSLSPGVAFTQNPGLDRPFEPTHIVGYAMGGVRANRSEITLDGAPNTALNHRWGAGDLMAGYTPPVDVVHEFKVETATFDASVGHTQGGVTSMTLKSGGNSLHGTGYYSALNPVLNANLFFANKNGQERGDFNYHRYGASATGPVAIPGVL